MSELPKGWRATLLNEVVDKIVGGGTPSKSVPSYYEGDIPWMTVKDMNKSYLTDTIDHITQEAIDNSSTNVIPAGTPIIATRMSLGKIVRASFDSAINQDLKALFVDREIDDYYFEYWYRSQGLKIESLGTGTTVKGIRLEVINALEFPLAPVAEQKRIVEKLDEVLAQVDTIKARLDGIPDLLKRFRQSVLASAVSGKLTEEWRVKSELLGTKPTLTNKRYKIPDDFPVWDVPNSWELSPIGNFCSFQQGMQIAKSTRYETSAENRLPILRIGNYATGFTSGVDYVELDSASLIAEPEDLILTRTGETRGRVLTGYRGVFHNNTFRINYESSLVNRMYLYHALNELKTQNYILEVSGRSAQPDLTHKKFGPCPIALPPLVEQKEIARLVDQYFTFADTIETQVKKAQARVDNLTQSILAKAFRGELVAQDPNDEPADKLLERIAEARKEAEALAKAAKKAEAAKKRSVKSA